MNKIIKALLFIIIQVVNWILPLLFLYIIIACTEDGLVISYIAAFHLGILFTFILAILHYLVINLKEKYDKQ